MPDSNKASSERVRIEREIKRLKRSRASHRGEPEALRDLDEEVRRLEDELRKLR